MGEASNEIKWRKLACSAAIRTSYFKGRPNSRIVNFVGNMRLNSQFFVFS